MAALSKAAQFDRTLRGLRDDYQKKRANTNLYPPFDRPMVVRNVKNLNGINEHNWWYKDEQDYVRYLRIYDIPDTLSGNIIRLIDNLPPLSGDIEIYGNEVKHIEHAPPPPPPPEYLDDDDFEDVTAQLAMLPVVPVIDDRHFLKKPKYASEINNLLACQGGSCPGTPLCSNIVQLLGKTADGQLVFPKYKPRVHAATKIHSLETYKSWFLQVLRGIQALHNLGIVHRDLRMDNFVWSQDDRTLLICDLESHWGNRGAPEILNIMSLDAGWSPASDIWDIGDCLKMLLYGNAPINAVVQAEWEVPEPFTAIVKACWRNDPSDRPSLDELTHMVEAIKL